MRDGWQDAEVRAALRRRELETWSLLVAITVWCVVVLELWRA